MRLQNRERDKGSVLVVMPEPGDRSLRLYLARYGSRFCTKLSPELNAVCD
jgi:hypothetical protein